MASSPGPVNRLRLHLVWSGGTGSFAELSAATSDKTVRRALREGAIVRVAHGRYALPAAADEVVEAFRLAGACSHLTAAGLHGWAVAARPPRTSITVPRSRHVDVATRRRLDVHFSPLTAAEVAKGRTDPLRTVLDCAKTLPFEQGLAVGDSALRSGAVEAAELRQAASLLRGRGSSIARRVAHCADAAAANPFESVLRAICLEVPGLAVVTQFEVRDEAFYARVDLADEGLRLVIEADSFEFHGSRAMLAKDARRYNALVARGWRVLRFTWEDVFLDSQGVRETLMAAVEGARSVPTYTTA